MIAESHGKLSPASTQEFGRLEDLLTDYVFGAIRHLPRTRVLGHLLTSLFPDVRWPMEHVGSATIEFWPLFGNTEPDVLIRVGAETIIVEAKLWSGFGKGLAEDDDQLIREFRVVSEWANARLLEAPYVLAVTAGLERPVEVDAANAFIGTGNGARVRWTNWQTIARLLEECQPSLEAHESLLIDDVLRVMDRRGVRRMFEGFAEEDYWLMAAAQRRSSESVFPTLATFCQDLLTRLKDEGFEHGTGANSIMSHNSTSLDHPERWGVNYFYLPLWPKTWPVRREWWDAVLFVQFSMHKPEVWVGYRQRIKTRQRETWMDSISDTVGALQDLGDRTLAACKYPDFSHPTRASDAGSIDVQMMETMLKDTEIFFSVHRVLPLDALVGTALVAEMMLEDVAAVESVPILLGDGLSKKG